MKRVVYTSLIKIYYICAGGTASSPRATLCRANQHNSHQTQACTQTIQWGKGGHIRARHPFGPGKVRNWLGVVRGHTNKTFVLPTNDIWSGVKMQLKVNASTQGKRPRITNTTTTTARISHVLRQTRVSFKYYNNKKYKYYTATEKKSVALQCNARPAAR